jgi:hypothetical protein
MGEPTPILAILVTLLSKEQKKTLQAVLISIKYTTTSEKVLLQWMQFSFTHHKSSASNRITPIHVSVVLESFKLVIHNLNTKILKEP